MNILVCISRVPDTATKITVDGSGNKISSQGVKYILNPYDEFALEEGIRLIEKNGGEVTALTVGDGDSTDILRTALAMGAEKAILIKGIDSSTDSFTIAKNIADKAKSLNPDVIFFGRQSIDFDSYQMASLVGELLELPTITMTSKLEINGNSIVAERDIEGGREEVNANLPAVISVQKGINEPRYPKLPQIMKAKSKPIEEITVSDVNSTAKVTSMDIPSKSRVGKILGDSENDINELVKLLHEEAKVI